MILKLYSNNTSQRDIDRICDILKGGGVMIYPTDSLYAFGCAIDSPKAVERVKQLTGKDTSDMSLMFNDISSMAEYCRIDNATFKLLKRNLPGAITFILRASSRIPDKVIAKRKTIGACIADNAIARAIVESLGAPIFTTSLKSVDEVEYIVDPELIHEQWGRQVDIVIDGGIGLTTPTTIVDISDGDVEVVREGEAELK